MSAYRHARRLWAFAELEKSGHGLALFLHRARLVWPSWSLELQFSVCASAVLLPAMMIIGWWLSARIQDSVTHGAANNAALHMESFIQPLVQDLATSNRISDEHAAQIGRLLRDTPLGQKVLAFKILAHGGIVVASNRPELVGKIFAPSAGARRAWSGAAVARFAQLDGSEHMREKEMGISLMEVYVPLRAYGSGQIIAVAEFYECEADLTAALWPVQIQSWLVVATVTVSMWSALFTIVRRGSQTIERQRASLERRVGELSQLLAENRRLRDRARYASARVAESNEHYLRRLSADLHDGPAQLIGLALLRVGETDERVAVGADPGPGAALPPCRTSVRSVLTSALKDIREIAAGLAAPEIGTLSLGGTLAAAVTRHEQLTGTSVVLRQGALPDPVSPAVKLCAYRFVQEGLANAFRHANGLGQEVRAETDGANVVLTVEDHGADIDPARNPYRPGLGLRGLVDRVESLGGDLRIDSVSGRGTRLIARLPLANGDR